MWVLSTLDRQHVFYILPGLLIRDEVLTRQALEKNWAPNWHTPERKEELTPQQNETRVRDREKHESKSPDRSTELKPPGRVSTENQSPLKPLGDIKVDVKSIPTGPKSDMAKPEVKSSVKPDAKPVAKADPKPDAKLEAKQYAKPAAKVDSKSDLKLEAKADTKPEPKIAQTTAARPELKPPTKPEAKPEVAPDNKTGKHQPDVLTKTLPEKTQAPEIKPARPVPQAEPIKPPPGKVDIPYPPIVDSSIETQNFKTIPPVAKIQKPADRPAEAIPKPIEKAPPVAVVQPLQPPVVVAPPPPPKAPHDRAIRFETYAAGKKNIETQLAKTWALNLDKMDGVISRLQKIANLPRKNAQIIKIKLTFNPILSDKLPPGAVMRESGQLLFQAQLDDKVVWRLNENNVSVDYQNLGEKITDAKFIKTIEKRLDSILQSEEGQKPAPTNSAQLDCKNSASKPCGKRAENDKVL